MFLVDVSHSFADIADYCLPGDELKLIGDERVTLEVFLVVIKNDLFITVVEVLYSVLLKSGRVQWERSCLICQEAQQKLDEVEATMLAVARHSELGLSQVSHLFWIDSATWIHEDLVEDRVHVHREQIAITHRDAVFKAIFEMAQSVELLELVDRGQALESCIHEVILALAHQPSKAFSLPDDLVHDKSLLFELLLLDLHD